MTRTNSRTRRPFRRSALSLECLEGRLAPATSLGTPALLDPAAVVRVDQGAYTLRGTLQQAARNGATISVFRDSNQNGVYDAGRDALAASATVAKGGTAFAVTAPLAQDAPNQFFL